MTYSTDDMSKAGRSSLRAVRLWEEKGLLGVVERNEKDHRRFTSEHMETAKIIAAAQMAGMSLSAIKIMLGNWKDTKAKRKFWSDLNDAIKFLTEMRAGLFQDDDL